jgi:hypothetical protein
MKNELKIFDNPRNVNILLRIYFVSLALLVVIGIFIPKHGDFGWENKLGFYCAYGFLSCVVLVFVAAGLRRLIKRDENYYDR